MADEALGEINSIVEDQAISGSADQGDLQLDSKGLSEIEAGLVLAELIQAIEAMLAFTGESLRDDYDVDDPNVLTIEDWADIKDQAIRQFQTKLATDFKALKRYQDETNPIPALLAQSADAKKQRDEQLHGMEQSYAQARAVFSALAYANRIPEVDRLRGQVGQNGWKIVEGSPALGVIVELQDPNKESSEPKSQLRLTQEREYNSQISGITVAYSANQDGQPPMHAQFTIASYGISREVTLVPADAMAQFQQAMAAATTDIRQIFKDNNIGERVFSRYTSNTDITKYKEYRQRMLWNGQTGIPEMVDREKEVVLMKQRINPYDTNP